MIKIIRTCAFLALAADLVIGSYAGAEKNAPETQILESLAKVYEPVTFSHDMHSLVVEECAVCHHNSPAGQTPSCNICHKTSATSEGSPIPGLKDAYHKQCMGCHKEIDMGPTGCTDCHAKRTTKIPASSEKSTKEPVKEATKVGPEMLTLNSLEQRYEPVTFSHGMHTEITENCAICHHHSPTGQTPACRECHGEPFDPKNLNMPGLKGAYHLQCMGCHREMGGGPMGCYECHTKKVSPTKEMEKK